MKFEIEDAPRPDSLVLELEAGNQFMKNDHLLTICFIHMFDNRLFKKHKIVFKNICKVEF